MKLYTGSQAGPAIVRGKHQTRLALFALKYPGWHSFAGDRATVRALKALEAMKLLEVAYGSQQFRWNDTRTGKA